MQAHALGSRRTKCTSSASATGYPIALPVTSQAKEEGGWASFFQGRRICGPESVRISEDSLRGTAGRSVEYFCRARLLAVEAAPPRYLPPSTPFSFSVSWLSRGQTEDIRRALRRSCPYWRFMRPASGRGSECCSVHNRSSFYRRDGTKDERFAWARRYVNDLESSGSR